MKNQNRPSLLALSALLLCTLQQPAESHSSSSTSSSSSSSSSSEVGGRSDVGTAPNGFRHTNTSSDANHNLERPSLNLREAPEHVGGFNSSRGDISTVTSERSVRTPGWSPGEGESPVCAYRVMEGGIGGQLCFRNALIGYKCHAGDCRTVVSVGNLVANILINGSVLLQWTRQDAQAKPNGTDLTRDDTSPPSNTVFSGRRHRRGGYELSCWWNGSYTQFECAGVHLGSGCTDFLLAELHENIPYRLCLRPLAGSTAEQRDCVEFTLPPSGMQDIVIAMTTVGGAICVMLVIICLLVAYITENIMSPSTQHSYSYRTHSRH